MVVSASLTNLVDPHIIESKSIIESGKASYYSNHFTGKKTASGELYQPNLLTAAHKTLPLGTLVLVTCQETHKSVIVKVNDRGPYARNRIIDLSKKAFQEINSVQKGEIDVMIKVLRD